MGPLMSSVEDIDTPLVGTSNAMPLLHDAGFGDLRQTTSAELGNERKKKKKKSEADWLGIVLQEEDWRTSVKTRGQLRMILNPVEVKPEPELKVSPSSKGDGEDINTTTRKRNAVSESVTHFPHIAC